MSQLTGNATPAKRRTTDVARLMASEHHVIVPDSANSTDFYVKLLGPADRYINWGDDPENDLFL
jgi:hypothetical protein